MMAEAFCDVPALGTISNRLGLVFPEGIDYRNYLTRDIAAKTVFVMFYAGAVEGSNNWIRPNQVTRMTDTQSRATGVDGRREWVRTSLQPGKAPVQGRWYADNTREPIRDETIRLGLIQVGAVVEREGLATTSAKPRYALSRDFAELFLCDEEDFHNQVKAWQDRHLPQGARARLALIRRSAVVTRDGTRVLVTFPNGETRHMSPGPSSVISKAVIEEFATRFLARPGVILVSESRTKVVARDDELARAVGLNITPDRILPDIILVDAGPARPLLVFVEVVASAGPINDVRMRDLADLAGEAGYSPRDLAFVTAFMSKTDAAFRASSSSIAWGSFVWFASDPEHIVWYRRQAHRKGRLLSDILRV